MDPRYPIGKFQPEENLNDERRRVLIDQIAELPAKLRAAVMTLNEKQLDTPYREGGWTVRQVVHHVADSHLNAYCRFKLAVTEKEPTIKPYDQERWAETADARTLPPSVSLTLLDGLHARWVALLRSMSKPDFLRVLHHPELGTVSLERYLGLYAWHGRHHTAHVTELKQRMGWK